MKMEPIRVLDVQEKERSRIACELHDSSLQDLTHLIHMLELSFMYIDNDPISAKLELESCIQNLKHTISGIRDTIFDLRPMTFDDLGFKQCVENEVLSLKSQYKNCEIIFEIDDIRLPDVQEKREIFNIFLVTLYRIIREALLNAFKHSEADNLSFVLKEKENELVVNITDNGNGFSLEEAFKGKHFGISIMYERVYLLNGKINIISNIGEGTNIEIKVPKP